VVPRAGRDPPAAVDPAAEVTVATIHQRLRNERGLTASMSSLWRYVMVNVADDPLVMDQEGWNDAQIVAFEFSARGAGRGRAGQPQGRRRDAGPV